MKKIVLISNEVMHYRVSLYNYFNERFRAHGYSLIVRANKLQQRNPFPLNFDFKEIPFNLLLYRNEIVNIDPDHIILFLHLRDTITFPLLYWLKLKKISTIFWTKGANLDDPDNRIRKILFHHMHNLVDGLILYSKNELPFIMKKNWYKVTIANNTLNYLDYPVIETSKDELKKEFNIKFKKVALFAGRMDIGNQRKKVHHAIHIFKNIDHPDYGLILVGSGLHAELNNAMNHQNTIYLGEIYDDKSIQISKLFKLSDIFLMPGHVGLGLNQAFFWGLPVLTEKGKQPPEIHYLVDGRNGYIVEEDDVDALKEKVLHLFSNEDERSRLGENAQKDILKHGSVENMFNGILENIRQREKWTP